MKISLSFKRMFLEPGKTFAVPMVAGARVRVVDGMVWATTSSSPDDVWLKAGEEHTVESAGLTVIESVARSTVELVPPSAPSSLGQTNRYEIATPRAACHMAALAMAAITIAVLVVLPAKLGSDSHEARARLESNIVATTPTEAVDSQRRGIVKPPETITQASTGAASPTRVQ